MGLFDKLFRKKESSSIKQLLKIFGREYENNLYSTNDQAYDVDNIRAIINRIATDAAQIRVKHSVGNGDDKRLANGNLDTLLNFRPNSIMSAFDFYYKITTNLFLESNSFVYLNWMDDSKGKPYLKELVPITYQSVEAMEDVTGEIYLKFTFEDGTQKTIHYDNLIHIRKFFKNDVFGEKSEKVINYSTELIKASNQAVFESLQKSGKMRGILKLSTVANETDKRKMRDDFVSDTFDLKNANGIGILDKMSEWQDVKAEFNLLNEKQLDYMKKNISDFYNIANPIIMGDFTESQYQAYFSTIVQPLAVQMEQEFTWKIFTKREFDLGNRLSFDVIRLQMGSMQQTASYVSTMMDRGVLNINEVREMLQMPKIPNGDKRRVTLNNVDLDVANEYQNGTSDDKTDDKEDKE